MIATLLTRYLSILFQFLIIFSTFYIYGDVGRGVIVALTSTYTVVGIILSLTIGRGFMDLYRVTDKGIALKKLMSTTIVTTLFLIILSFVAHLALLRAIPSFYGDLEQKYVQLYFAASSYYIWVQIAQYIYSVYGKLKLYNIQTISLGFLQLSLCIFSFLFNVDFYIFVIVNSLLLLSFFVVSVCTIKFFQPFNFAFNFLITKKLCKSGLKLHLDTLGGYMFSAVSILIVNFYSPLNEVAKYDLVVKFFSLVIVFPQVMQLIFNKKLFTRGNANIITEQLNIFKFVAVCYSILLIFILLICFFFIDYEFLVILLIFGSFFSYYWCTIMSPHWIKHGKALQLSLVTLSSGLFAISLMLYLLPKIGVVAAALGVFTSYSVAGVVNIFFYLKDVKQDALQ